MKKTFDSDSQAVSVFPGRSLPYAYWDNKFGKYIHKIRHKSSRVTVLKKKNPESKAQLKTEF